jgi:hypothetical protein
MVVAVALHMLESLAEDPNEDATGLDAYDRAIKAVRELLENVEESS